MARLTLSNVQRATDANSDTEAAALRYVYIAGTTTPVTTYSDAALTSAQTFPVVADDGIFAQTYLPNGSYKVVIKTATGTTLYEEDDVIISPGPRQFEEFGAVGDYDLTTGTGTDDSTAIIAAIAWMQATGKSVEGHGHYYIGNTSLNIYPDAAVNYWDWSTELRPGSIKFHGALVYAGTGNAINHDNNRSDFGNTDGDVIGHDIYVEHLINTAGLIAAGTPGAGAENVGIRLTGAAGRVTVNSLSGFNFGILMDAAYNANIDVGNAFYARTAIYARADPNVANSACNNCRITVQRAGGVYTNTASLGGDRETYSCNRGIHIENGNGFIVDTGTVQYTNLETNGVAIELGEYANSCRIMCYAEGGAAEVKILQCVGTNNHIWIAGAGSPTLQTTIAYVGGVGNIVHQMPARGPGSKAASATTGAIVVEPGNYVTGAYKTNAASVVSAHPHNLATASATVAFNGTATHAALDNVPPDINDPMIEAGTLPWSSTSLVESDDSTNFIGFTCGTYASPESPNTKAVFWIRNKAGEVRQPQFTLVRLDAASDMMTYGHDGGLAGKLRADESGEWQRIEYLVPNQGETVQTWRLYVRNAAADGGAGFEIEVAWPFITLNIDSPVVHSFEAFTGGAGVAGSSVMATQHLMRPQSNEAASVAALASNILNTSGRPVVEVTAISAGQTVSSITNMRANSSCLMINNCNEPIHVSNAAGVWASGFNVDDGEAVRFYYDGTDHFCEHQLLLRMKSFTTAQIEDVASGANTSEYKQTYVAIMNSDTHKVLYAAGGAAADVWRDSAGATVHSPV